MCVPTDSIPLRAAKEEVLHRLKDVVLSTATFLADFPERRIGTGTDGAYLDLGPPLVSAAEGEGPYDVWNPRSVPPLDVYTRA